jgi:hypothetical protein
MISQKELSTSDEGQPETVYEILKKIVTFRGRYALPAKSIEQIMLPKVQIEMSDISISVKAVSYVSYGGLPILVCNIGDKRYITYKQPRNKLWDKLILDIYMMDEHNIYENEYTSNRHDGVHKVYKTEEKERILGMKVVTVFQLSKTLEKALLKRNLLGDFNFAYEEAILTEV